MVQVGSNPTANLGSLIQLTREAAGRGAELVLFPEAVITGLVNNDNPDHDLVLGQSIPGPATAAVCALAREFGVWVALGLLESDAGALYDAAVLIDATGAVRLKHRRVNPQWHGSRASLDVYRQGERVDAVTTPWGKMAFLICGDLFDEHVAGQARALSPDWVLFPFARCFAGGGVDQDRWDREEMPAYVARVQSVGAPALMVYYLADGDTLPEDHSFGGAFVVLADGTIHAQMPLGVEGLLVVDTP